MGIKFTLSRLFAKAVEWKNQKWDRNPPIKIHSIPIVSIGNITVGGTGKTALIENLIYFLQKNNVAVGIVSRGYGGKYQGVAKVDPSEPNASEMYGDEPTMLAKKFNRVPIYLCPKRCRATRALIDVNPEVEIIIADDGFQHRALYRDLDVALLDLSQPMETYELLPLGMAREPLKNLSRADWVILTKGNLADSQNKESLLNWFSQQEWWKEQNIARAEFNLTGIKKWNEGDCQKFSLKSYVLVSALGNPKAFESSCKELIGPKMIKHFQFEDHHSYNLQDVEHICSYLDEHHVELLVTSAKDAVKLEKFREKLPPVWVTQLGVKIVSIDSDNEDNKFYEDILRLVR